MGEMFSFKFSNVSVFNQPLGDWDTSNVAEMDNMFDSAISYNQDLSSWNVDNVTSYDNFDNNTPSWTLPKPNFTNCTP
jgi:surface protein